MIKDEIVLPSSNVCEHDLDQTADRVKGNPDSAVNVALLTGGFDKPYALGISRALASRGVRLDIIGNREVHGDEITAIPSSRFLDLHGGWSTTASIAVKVGWLFGFYCKLIAYALRSDAKIFHILWNNKVPWFDRTILTALYKLSGKKVVLTVHNVNTAKRDGCDSWWNRLTLRIQYALVDHHFVHTAKMGEELTRDYKVPAQAISVIPFGINDAVPQSMITEAEARAKLGISPADRTILFFGNIRQYKGVHLLIEALPSLLRSGGDQYRVVIAGGEPNEEGRAYWQQIRSRIKDSGLDGQVLQKIEYIPDDAVELYFKAADVAVLPYTHIYQSGVLFLSYSFGLPVIATDIGSFREEIQEGKTGFLCQADDPVDLAKVISKYFSSDLYETLPARRQWIRNFANTKYSWGVVSDETMRVYSSVVK